MADMPPFMPSPYSVFDPSQFQNPFSQYRNQALPWPPSYVGTPNDALGNPIASYQPPAAPQGPSAAPPPQGPMGMTLGGQMPVRDLSGQTAIGYTDPRAFNNAYLQWQRTTDQTASGRPGSGGGQAPMPPAPQFVPNMWQQPQQGTAAAPAAATQPSNWDAAIAALANPGRVTTRGATVPQAQPGWQPSNGVLQNFLANWSPAASGPGSGFQQAFNRSLRGR